jgi:hypothetical protein
MPRSCCMTCLVLSRVLSELWTCAIAFSAVVTALWTLLTKWYQWYLGKFLSVQTPFPTKQQSIKTSVWTLLYKYIASKCFMNLMNTLLIVFCFFLAKHGFSLSKYSTCHISSSAVSLCLRASGTWHRAGWSKPIHPAIAEALAVVAVSKQKAPCRVSQRISQWIATCLAIVAPEDTRSALAPLGCSVLEYNCLGRSSESAKYQKLSIHI